MISSTHSGSHLLSDSISDAAIILVDPEGLIVAWHPVAEQILGYQSEAVMGKPWQDILQLHLQPGENAWSVIKAQVQAASDSYHKLEVLAFTVEGHCCPLFVTIAPLNLAGMTTLFSILLQTQSNPALRATMPPAQDVVQLQDEPYLRQQLLELEEKNKLLSDIIDNAPAVIFMKDAEALRFSLYNKAAAQCFGYQVDEVLGKKDVDIFPAGQAAFCGFQDRRTLQELSMIEVPEEPLQIKNGDIRYLDMRKVPILDVQGKPKYLLALAKDVTEERLGKQYIHQLNQQLQTKVRALDASNQELENFSYAISHDLRTPLRIISGFNQILQDDYRDKLDEQGLHYLTRVAEGCQQMDRLIEAMLTLSRIDQMPILQEDTVNFCQMAYEIAQHLQVQEPHRTVNFQCSSAVTIKADSRLIQVILKNLIENAWKYTANQSQGIIEVGSLNQEPMIYYVKDNGIGFDNASQNRMFHIFQRLKNAESFPGTGIGLATVSKIIQRYGGTIWADGRLNQGATFYFTLGPTHT